MRPRRPLPPVTGEPVFYRGADYAVLGSVSQRRRTVQMRYVGTGKAPDGQYVKGQVFDVDYLYPDALAEAEDKGWIKQVAPEDDPGRSPLQIANAVVRGDPLVDPVDAKIADDNGYVEDGRPTMKAHAAVALQDPDAEESDYDDAVDKERRIRGSAYPDEVAYASASATPAPRSSKPAEKPS